MDVLTLSVTLIPRTLNMALSGIRDMSLHRGATAEPPSGADVRALSRTTACCLMPSGVSWDAADRYTYLHNRVESIERCANMWQQRLPDARIGIVHGKMGQKEIAKVMNEMADGEIDILVCTTIIETGIDISEREHAHHRERRQ